MKLALDVRYPDDYPDVLPELSLDAVEGELEEDEREELLRGLQTAVNTPFEGARRASDLVCY